jgi:hypothetical protein
VRLRIEQRRRRDAAKDISRAAGQPARTFGWETEPGWTQTAKRRASRLLSSRCGNSAAASSGCLCRQDSLNLLEVIEIVSREHLYDRFDALGAPFVMQPMVLPLLGRESLQEREIRLTLCSILLEGCPEISLVVMQRSHPDILVKADDWASRRAEDSADAVPPDEFGIRQVRFSAIDHLLAAGRFRAFAPLIPSRSLASFAGAAACSFIESRPFT